MDVRWFDADRRICVERRELQLHLVQLTFEPAPRPNDCLVPVSVSRAAARDRLQSLQSRRCLPDQSVDES